MAINDLLYVGFNSRVVALHKKSGQLVWQWKSPKGTGYPAILVDANRLFVSVDGYTYALYVPKEIFHGEPHPTLVYVMLGVPDANASVDRGV